MNINLFIFLFYKHINWLGGKDMNCIIPFTKDIKFKTNISEIVSISLEHEYTINDRELLGNFLITGEYKTHEVSVNKESFEYVLPFSVTLTTNVDEQTLDFNIEDFTYEVIDNNMLKVDIEYSVKADEKEVEEPRGLVFEKEEDNGEEQVEEFLEKLDEEVEQKEERDEEKEVIEVKDVEVKKEKVVKEEESIIESINEENDEFVTYHIHILKENETVEMICGLYNITSSLLEEYNDLTNLEVDCKIIIPEEYE